MGDQWATLNYSVGTHSTVADFSDLWAMQPHGEQLTSPTSLPSHIRPHSPTTAVTHIHTLTHTPTLTHNSSHPHPHPHTSAHTHPQQQSPTFSPWLIYPYSAAATVTQTLTIIHSHTLIHNSHPHPRAHTRTNPCTPTDTIIIHLFNFMPSTHTPQQSSIQWTSMPPSILNYASGYSSYVYSCVIWWCIPLPKLTLNIYGLTEKTPINFETW